MTADIAGTIAVALALDEPEQLLSYLKQQAMARAEVLRPLDEFLADKWDAVSECIARVRRQRLATSSEGPSPRRRSTYKTFRDGKRDEHRVVFEERHGPIPPGYDVHHKDENKWNNDPGNLEALPKTHHRRLHFPNWKLINGVWWKRCSRCLEFKTLSEFHKEGESSRGKAHCKPCNVLDGREQRANAKAKRLSELLP